MRRIEDELGLTPAPDAGPVEQASGWRDTRLFEFACALLLVGDGFGVPVIGLPLAQLVLFPLCVVGLARKPTVKMGRWGWVYALLSFVLVYLAVVSATSTGSEGASSWTRRIIRLAVVVGLALLIAVGRLHLPSLVRGLLVALFINAALFGLHLAPDNYSGALTGFLGDKNRAGLYYALVGLLALGQVKRTVPRVLLVAAFGGLLWWTESRTSMTGYAAGLVFAALLARRHVVVRWAGGFGLWSLVSFLESNMAQAGVFESRWGSDLLRGRIDAATEVKVAASPWFGRGLGEAYVVIRDQRWFFHNAYETLRVEGGWPYLIAIVVLTVMVGLRPFSPGDRSPQRVLAAGATVAILICAWKLGEVFMTIPWALLVGAALNATLVADQRAAAEVDELSGAAGGLPPPPGMGEPR